MLFPFSGFKIIEIIFAYSPLNIFFKPFQIEYLVISTSLILFLEIRVSSKVLPIQSNRKEQHQMKDNDK